MNLFPPSSPSTATETPRPKLTAVQYVCLLLLLLGSGYGAFSFGKFLGQRNAQLSVTQKEQLQLDVQKDLENKLNALQSMHDKLQAKTNSLQEASVNWEIAFNDLKSSYMVQTERMSMQAYKNNQSKNCELIQFQISDTQKIIDNTSRLLSMGIELSSPQDQQKNTELLQARVKSYQDQLLACKK